MHAPQIILIVFFSLVMGLNLAMHGKPRTGNYNFFGTCIAVAIEVSILYWGGFFN